MPNKTKVLVINAIATNDYNAKRLAYLKELANSDTDLHMVSIDKGYLNLRSEMANMVNGVEVVEKAKWAEQNGFHAVVINCFDDPGMEVCRESVNIPVIGAGEASLMIASRLGHRFAVFALYKSSIPRLERHIENYGLRSVVSDVIALNIDVTRLQAVGIDDELKNIIAPKIEMAIDRGAEALTLACTAAYGIDQLLKDICPVPVVDPAAAALKVAEMMGSLYRLRGLSHSKIGFYLNK